MLEAALSQVAAALRGAEDPWWVIGSAAVRLHGVDTSVADIDVLVVRVTRRGCCGRGRGR